MIQSPQGHCGMVLKQIFTHLKPLLQQNPRGIQCTPNQKRYLIQQFNEQKIRRREPVELDIPVERPALLKNLINYYIREYEIGIKEMAAIFAIPLEDYLDYYGECENEKRN